MPSGGNFTACNCGPDTTACETPTEPLATVGLCLADGTPIAVTVVRDCAGFTTSEGWINLTTGAWSAGPPPAGAVACGDSRSIQVSGVFCDVDPDTGDVLGLVLVEYSYAADGSIDGVRLVDAVTGDTYAPQGEVTTCPAGVEQPERDLVQLCDLNDDESGAVLSTPFVRDYQRDESGAITGYTDYTLSGEPYTPSGEVSACQTGPEQAPEPCQHCETLTLCDLRPDESPGDPEVAYETIPLAELPPAGSYGDGSPVSGTLPNGIGYTVNVGEWLEPQGHYTFYPYDGTQLWTFTEPVYLRFGLRGLNITPTECYVLPEGAVAESISPNHTWNPDNRQLCEITGQSSATDESVFLLGPVTELPIVPSGSETGGRGPGLIEAGLPVEEPTPGGTPHAFLRTVCRDCDGAIISTTDTTLNGEPYTSIGDVIVCGDSESPAGGDLVDCDDGRAMLVKLCGSDESPGEPAPCRDSATVLLCELPGDDDTGGPVTVTDTAPIRQNETTLPLPGGAPALWAGGTFVFPADSDASETDGQQVYRVIAAELQADRPSCDDGTARVTASLRVHLDGPTAGVGTVGRMSLYVSGVQVSTQAVPMGAPVGYEGTLTVSATAPAAALAAGDVVAELWLETYHVGGRSWTVDQFTAAAEYGLADCETQFLRKIVTDCETGETISVTDTTLDGEPYEVTGEVGQCTTTGDGSTNEPCQHCETLALCDFTPDESPGDPEIAYAAIPLAELPPAGSYGDGSPVSGTLPNGVGYTVNVGEWISPQNHYTFYPYDGTQTWEFTEPVYLRFGLRGLNITPTECYILPEGAVAESISPNHTWNPDNRQLCEITGQSSAVDESVFLLGPVTELPIVPSGSSTGGRGPGLIEVGLPVEDTGPAAGSSTAFLRTVCRDCQGITLSVTDTTLDGEEYTPSGVITVCGSGAGGSGGDGTESADLVDCDDGRALLVKMCRAEESPGEEEPPCQRVQTLQLCDVSDDESGTVLRTPFLRTFTYDCDGALTGAEDTDLDGAPYTVTGTAGACEEERPLTVLEECRCDDADEDGAGDTPYVELIAVEEDGTLRTIGTYTEDLSAPYTPVSPVPCEQDAEGAPEVRTVRAHRVQLAPGASWSAGWVPTLQSVTVTAHGGAGIITADEEASTLFEGESVTWSVAREDDAILTGPLLITAGPGTVTVTYTSSANA